MAGHETLHRALRNCRSAGQYVDPDGFAINCRRVMELLRGAAAPSTRNAGLRRNANALLELMERGEWRITAGAHEGGTGRGGRADATTHVTVRVGGDSYHLRMDARGHLFEISGGDLPRFLPGAPPGAPAQRDA